MNVENFRIVFFTHIIKLFSDTKQNFPKLKCLHILKISELTHLAHQPVKNQDDCYWSRKLPRHSRHPSLIAYYVAYSFISLALITERRVVQGRNDKLYLSSFLLVQVHTILRMPTIYLLLAKIMLLLLAPPFLFATLATCFFGSLSHRYVTEDFPTKLSKRGRIKLILSTTYLVFFQSRRNGTLAEIPPSQ